MHTLYNDLGLKNVYGFDASKSEIDLAKRSFSELAENFFIHNAYNHELPPEVPQKSDLIISADEMGTPELSEEIKEMLRMWEDARLGNDVTGMYVKRRVYFMGRWIKHGGYYPIWLLRIWQKGKARYEERAMDEHLILLEGKAIRLEHDIIDWNRKDLNFWIEKHNRFASREMQSILKPNPSHLDTSLFSSQEKRKRWLKEKLYHRLPLFIRAFLYFLYRYFFRLGFLDGKEGLIFHFLQGFWYRFLVDAFIYERRKKMRS